MCSVPDLAQEAGSVPRATSQPSRGKQPIDRTPQHKLGNCLIEVQGSGIQAFSGGAGEFWQRRISFPKLSFYETLPRCLRSHCNLATEAFVSQVGPVDKMWVTEHSHCAS